MRALVVRGVLRGARGFACGLSLVVLIMIVCTALGHSARAAEDLAASYGLGPGDEVRVTVIAAGFDSGSPSQICRASS